MIHCGILDARHFKPNEKIALSFLSDPERQRVQTFSSPIRRGEYVTGKLFSRWVAQRICDRTIPLHKIPFTYDVSGKPRLGNGTGFSLAHTDGVFMVAIGPGELGIDIEKVQPLEAGVEELLFSASERQEFLHQPDSAQEQIRRWTLKEAYAKYTGLGLAMDFPSIDLRRLQAEGLTLKTGKQKMGDDDEYQYACCSNRPAEKFRLQFLTRPFQGWLREKSLLSLSQ